MSELGKIKVTLKTGNEELTLGNKGIGTSINHFWRWSVSDLLSNATRGVFAEFIVATATGIDTTLPREEWSAFDLTTPDGIRLEIKSAAYLQSWNQRELSKISFSTKLSLYWDSTTNKQETVAKRHADVYVFCLLHHEDKQTVDPLNLDQWEFYVLATRQLNEYERSQHSISLKSLKRLTSPVSYGQLREEIERKNALNAGKPAAPSIPEIVPTSNLLPRDTITGCSSTAKRIRSTLNGCELTRTDLLPMESLTQSLRNTWYTDQVAGTLPMSLYQASRTPLMGK